MFACNISTSSILLTHTIDHFPNFYWQIHNNFTLINLALEYCDQLNLQILIDNFTFYVLFIVISFKKFRCNARSIPLVQ
jgi:hypothetical protein